MVYIKTLFDWKRSKYVPSLDNIIKLAKFFDCSVDKDKSIGARHIAVRLIFFIYVQKRIRGSVLLHADF